MDELITMLRPLLQSITSGGLKNDEALLTLIQAIIEQVNAIQRDMIESRKKDLELFDALGNAVEVIGNKLADLDNKIALMGYESVRRH
jgi:hypothetical protein